MAQNMNMRQKIFNLLTKLGDRDTYTLAAKELESIARDLQPATGNLQSFVSGILSVDSGDKPAVRKQCIHLLSVLSLSLPPNALSPYLSKILTRLTRRLRDRDSSIRSACVAAVSGLASRTTKPPFSSAFLKPLADTLFTEQEVNAQIGAALCLAAAIDSAPDPDPARLGRVLLPRLEKLVKCDGFKAKAAGLVVIGSVIGSGGVSGLGSGVMKGLVECLTGFLSSQDWAARKAAAEALGRLAIAERNSVAEFKAGCLNVFENRKYDKVKAAREVMNQMIEAWKEVPDLSVEASPPRSHDSSKEDASDGRYPTGSRVSSSTPGLAAATPRRRTAVVNKSTPPDSSSATTARKKFLRSSGGEKRSEGTVPYRKLGCIRALDWKTTPGLSNAENPSVGGPGRELREKNENLVRKNDENVNHGPAGSEENSQNFGGNVSAPRAAASFGRSSHSTAAAGVLSENRNSNHKDCEDLSMIRSQLVQIEQQQSSLLHMLQKFMGSSQNGMHALETRVHGLELALDEISYDLAVASGRISNGYSGIRCCLLPSTDLFRSKFWRKSSTRYVTSRVPASTGTPPRSTMQPVGSTRTSSVEMLNPRLRHHSVGRGFIMNPLAEIYSNPLVTNGSTGFRN